MAPLHRLQRSAVTNYISNLLRAIDTVRSDPAQLRNLVYELARMRVGQTTASHLNAEADIGEQLRLLDMAIHRVEILSRLDDEISDSIPPTLADRAMSSAQPRDPSINVNSFQSTRQSELYDGPVDLDKQPNIQPLSIYEEGHSSLHDRLSLSTYFRPIQIWNVETGQEGSLLRSRRGETFWIALSLVTAASVALMAFLITYMLLTDYGNGSLHRADPIQEVSSPAKTSISEPARSSVASPNTSTDSQALGFPLPTAYGIYAASEGRLIELRALPISVPDPRIAISATIATPSETIVSTGKVQFVIFRRDALFGAPDRISVRVVARVARELRFVNSKPVMATKPEGEWAIRSNSYEFRVGPVPDHSEMLLVHSEEETPLPAGRYALVLKGIGYDFTVAGPVTDPAQCIERTDAANGTIYSECRKGSN